MLSLGFYIWNKLNYDLELEQANLDQGYFLTCLQVFPASEETNMLMSLSDSSEPILPRKSAGPLVGGRFWKSQKQITSAVCTA